jgi:hypothetical protein
LLILSVAVSSFINVIAQQSASASAPTVGNLTKINPEKKIKEEDMQSKEISKEMNFPKNGEVFIESNSHNVIVKTWDQQKVKITTTVYYEGDGKKTDEEFLETAGISLKVVGSSVQIVWPSPVIMELLVLRTEILQWLQVMLKVIVSPTLPKRRSPL